MVNNSKKKNCYFCSRFHRVRNDTELQVAFRNPFKNENTSWKYYFNLGFFFPPRLFSMLFLLIDKRGQPFHLLHATPFLLPRYIRIHGTKWQHSRIILDSDYLYLCVSSHECRKWVGLSIIFYISLPQTLTKHEKAI